MVKQSSELSVWRHTLSAIKVAELRHMVEEGRGRVWQLSRWSLSPLVSSTALWSLSKWKTSEKGIKRDNTDPRLNAKGTAWSS